MKQTDKRPKPIDLTPLKNVLGGDIEKQRLELGWSQRELAEKMGTTPSRVSDMENKPTKISLEWLIHTLFVLGYQSQDFQWLFVEAIQKLEYNPHWRAGAGYGS